MNGTIDNAFWSNPLDPLQDKATIQAERTNRSAAWNAPCKGLGSCSTRHEQQLSQARDCCAFAKEDDT